MTLARVMDYYQLPNQRKEFLAVKTLLAEYPRKRAILHFQLVVTIISKQRYFPV